ncbi:MAG: RagB/SusD family nutrient uptake outer membrane protein, partial [Mucinivorans sp.]
KINKNIKLWLVGAALLAGTVACNRYLDRPPMSTITPDNYLWSENDLAAFAINRYGMLPSHGEGWGNGTFGWDDGTDNQIGYGYANEGIFVPGKYNIDKTGNYWTWGDLYTINYFIRTVMPRFNAGKITGNTTMIRHYIGEMYFFRAWFYFSKLKSLGDLPIITQILPDKEDVLINASVRQPRNQVARFIIADLDSALMYMSNSPAGGKNRLSADVANLVKSRVGLYEGSFEKNFAGTAYVPNGAGWPGKETYPSYTYDANTEVNFFLKAAMDASKVVADGHTLTANPANYDYRSLQANPYYDMFIDTDMGKYSEVLMWRTYSASLQIYHGTGGAINSGDGSGFTRGYMDAFLMKDGLPIYATHAAGSEYKGDDSLTNMKINRDTRLSMFVKGLGEWVALDNPKNQFTEWVPGLINDGATRSSTGYGIKKGLSHDLAQLQNAGGSGVRCTYGSLMFRAVEAYLNYIEASYLLNGSIDGTAASYWAAIRTRANVNPDFNATIAATVMDKEKGDWGAYTAGKLVDATLYNIRRERRSEFIAEGFRWDDLIRWRAMDQLISTPYRFEGMRLWKNGSGVGQMYEKYIDSKTQKTPFIEGPSSDKANMSSHTQSDYFQPWSIRQPDNNLFNGCRWHSAHYLRPIQPNHFKDTAIKGPDGTADINKSPIYQNPGWGRVAGGAPVPVAGF